MPVDHVSVKLSSAISSNTAQSYQAGVAPLDSYVVAEAGTIFAVTAVAQTLTSNARLNTVDVYRQPSGTSAASNSSTPITTAPIQLVGNNTSVAGSIAASNQRVAAGDILQLRTDTGTTGAQPAFLGLTATVLIKPD